MIIKKINYFLIADLITFWLSLITIWIFFILIIFNIKKSIYKKFLVLFILVLLLIFHLWNLLLFFILFEISIIIIITIIILWSYQLERLEAIFFILIFTLIFSLPAILTIIFNFKFNNFLILRLNQNFLIYLRFILFFLVKIPIFFIHLWLPKAHVESPIFGSIILAAILLKLGSYGIIRRFKIFVLFKKINILILRISIWGIIILSIICIIITDIKIIIAYSSIIHINLTITNILIFKNKRIIGTIIIVIGHGLCSSSLFFLANLIYKLSKSRRLLMNKGIANIMPQFNFWWFINCMNNVPVPPSLNILGEIICIKRLINLIWKLIVLFFFLIFFSSIFRIYLYFSIIHGKFSKSKTRFFNFNMKDTIVSLLHLIPLILIIVKPNIIII